MRQSHSCDSLHSENFHGKGPRDKEGLHGAVGVWNPSSRSCNAYVAALRILPSPLLFSKLLAAVLAFIGAVLWLEKEEF